MPTSTATIASVLTPSSRLPKTRRTTAPPSSLAAVAGFSPVVSGSSTAREWRASTCARNSSCRRVSPAISGWKEITSRFPWRTATGWPSTAASTSTSSPHTSTHGARMKTARTGGPAMPGIRRSASKERIWRPKALRRHSMSITPRCLRSSMIMPAQVPNTGAPEWANSRSGSASPSRSIPSVIVVDSPPGITRPSRSSRSAGTRTSRTSAPRSRSMRLCASKSPWSARTPTSTTSLCWRGAVLRRACASRASSSRCRAPRRRGRRGPGRRSAWSPRRWPRHGWRGPRT